MAGIFIIHDLPLICVVSTTRSDFTFLSLTNESWRYHWGKEERWRKFSFGRGGRWPPHQEPLHRGRRPRSIILNILCLPPPPLMGECNFVASPAVFRCRVDNQVQKAIPAYLTIESENWDEGSKILLSFYHVLPTTFTRHVRSVHWHCKLALLMFCTVGLRCGSDTPKDRLGFGTLSSPIHDRRAAVKHHPRGWVPWDMQCIHRLGGGRI